MAIPDWAREYFERGYAQRWGLAAPSDGVRLEARGLYDLLRLSPESRVLDIGCGHGRHAIALAAHGPDVIGLDFAFTLLDRARYLAVESRTRVRWVRSDMRCLPFRPQCADAAVVIDAFGFFETEEEHEAVLQQTAQALTIGGRLVLKVVNGSPILDAFRERDREERDGTVVAVSRALTLDPPRMIERLSISGSRGHGEYERRQRLYRAEELGAALERVGFSVVGVFASPDGTPFESNVSPTIWILSQRFGAV